MIDFDNSLKYPPIKPYYAFPRAFKPYLIVVHTMESGEGHTQAENVAAWCQLPKESRNGMVSGAHAYADDDSIVRGATDTQYVYCAKGANMESLNIEQAGRAAQSANEWADAYSDSLIHNTAKVVAFWSKKWGIPLRKLTPAEVGRNLSGVCGHYDVTIGKNVGSHTDPGPNYPWAKMLQLAQAELTMPQPTYPQPTRKAQHEMLLIQKGNTIREIVITDDQRNIQAVGADCFDVNDTQHVSAAYGSQIYRPATFVKGIAKQDRTTVAVLKQDLTRGTIKIANGWSLI